jgi:A/G-specific adenine glycosylase
VPAEIEQLLSLPGVGRYTAGAIASIAFDCRAPILDGNVVRVLCRLEKIASDPREPGTAARLWSLAEGILPPRRCGEFNSGLMELGATVCTPRQPKCLICPVQQFCQAAAAGVQDVIPMRRKSKPSPKVERWTICVRHGDLWLLERRPSTGRWAGLWQFPTIEAEEAAPPEARKIGRAIGLAISDLTLLGQVRHVLTHRRYVFTAFSAKARVTRTAANRKWVLLGDLDQFPLSRPQLKIAEMIRHAGSGRAGAGGS